MILFKRYGDEKMLSRILEFFFIATMLEDKIR